MEIILAVPALEQPDGTKVLCFHGRPKIDDAITGRWAPPGAEPFWKILTYKHFKSADWLKQYWEADNTRSNYYKNMKDHDRRGNCL